MYYQNITTTTATNVYVGKIKKARITINTGFTGTITVSDEAATTGSPAVGVITNPVTGGVYEYWGLQTGIAVASSTTGGDYTVSVDLSRPGAA